MEFITYAAEFSRVIFGVFSFICTFMFLYTLRTHWSTLSLQSSLISNLHLETQQADRHESLEDRFLRPSSNSNPNSVSLKSLGFQPPPDQRPRQHRRPIVKVVDPR